MQLPLVNYEEAKMLKEAGFDWKCTDYYEVYTDGEVKSMHNPTTSNFNKIAKWCFSRPTAAQALMYLREVKGVHCYTRTIPATNDVCAVIEFNSEQTNCLGFPTHSEAEHAALIKALETLKTTL